MNNNQVSLLPQSTIEEALAIHQEFHGISLIEVRVEFCGTSTEPKCPQMQLWVSGFNSSSQERQWWTAGGEIDMPCEEIGLISKEVDQAISLIRSCLHPDSRDAVSGRISWS